MKILCVERLEMNENDYRLNLLNRRFSPDCRDWIPPPDITSAHITSAFADAAWDSSLRVAGLGICFTDPLTGRSQTHAMIEEQVSSSVIGECLAILATLKKANDLDLSRLRLFSDSKECIDSINFHSSHRLTKPDPVFDDKARSRFRLP